MTIFEFLTPETVSELKYIQEYITKFQEFMQTNAKYFTEVKLQTDKLFNVYAGLMTKHNVSADFQYFDIFCNAMWQRFKKYLQDNVCCLYYVDRQNVVFKIYPEMLNFYPFVQDVNAITYVESAEVIYKAFMPKAIDYDIVYHKVIAQGIEDMKDLEVVNLQRIGEIVNELYQAMIKYQYFFMQNFENVIDCKKYIDNINKNQIKDFEDFIISGTHTLTVG